MSIRERERTRKTRPQRRSAVAVRVVVMPICNRETPVMADLTNQ